MVATDSGSNLDGIGVSLSLKDWDMIRFLPSFSETAAALNVEPVSDGRQLIRSRVVSLNMIGFFRYCRSNDPSSLERSEIATIDKTVSLVEAFNSCSEAASAVPTQQPRA